MNVREAFEYEPETGRLRRLKLNPGAKLYATAVANNGYRVVWFNRKLWLEHRLVWLWHHGQVPAMIDHRDRNKLNNRIENLRAATKSQNEYNCGPKASNKLGARGVHYNARGSRRPFIAQIVAAGRNRYLGSFATLSEATAAYRAASLRHAGEFSPYLGGAE